MKMKQLSTNQSERFESGREHLTMAAPRRVEVDEPRQSLSRRFGLLVAQHGKALEHERLEVVYVERMSGARQIGLCPLQQRVGVAHPALVQIEACCAIRRRRIEANVRIRLHALIGA